MVEGNKVKSSNVETTSTQEKPSLIESTTVNNTQKKNSVASAKYNLNSGVTRQVLAKISDKSANTSHRNLSRILIPYLGDTKITLGNLSLANADGVYNSGSDTIIIDTQLSEDNEFTRVVLHEALHAVLSKSIDNPTAEQQKHIENLAIIFNLAKKQYKGDNKNAFTNLHEFVSELMTDAKFQKDLESINFSKDKTLFERIMEIISNIISPAKSIVDVKNEGTIGAVSEVIQLIESTDKTIQVSSKNTLETIKKSLPEDFTDINDIFKSDEGFTSTDDIFKSPAKKDAISYKNDIFDNISEEDLRDYKKKCK